MPINSSSDQQLAIFSPLRSSKTVVQTIFANLHLVYLISCVCFHWTAGMEWRAFHWRLGFALQTLLICLVMGATMNVIIGNELWRKNQGFLSSGEHLCTQIAFLFPTRHNIHLWNMWLSLNVAKWSRLYLWMKHYLEKYSISEEILAAWELPKCLG